MKVKLSRDRLQALCAQTTNLVNIYEPENAHECLLHEHLKDLEDKFIKLLKRGQQMNTLNLTPTETMAFCQVFGSVELKHDPYTLVVVNTIIEGADKLVKQP